jgi:transcriptional regulator with XRE-family HTH domain
LATPFPLSKRFSLLLEQAEREDKNTTYTAISEATGISTANVRKIHTGDNQNPGLEVIDALAYYFDVSPAYFFLKSEQGCREYLREKDNQRLMARARQLDQDALDTLRGMIDYIERDTQNRSDD